MYKSIFNKREVFKFKRFGRKGYSLFACLGREVIIGTLSVATLSHARAEGIGVKPVTDDSISSQTDKEMILSSSTAGSTKKFKITVTDDGTLTATEVTQ